MIIIVCVDEKNGLMFNSRRQSRDSAVCRDILRECRGKKLYMSAYSGRLFEEARRAAGTKENQKEEGTGEAKGAEQIGRPEGAEGTEAAKGTGELKEAQIEISEEILNLAGDEDICFIEDTKITGFEEQIRKVILYKWNRRYPADRYFTLDLSGGSWELLRTEEFKGSSHERITKEVYERRK